jgi:aquaporin Z
VVPGPRRYVTELVATFFLTFTVLAAATQDLLLGALAIAAIVAVTLRCGAHGNPALTLAAVIGRRLPAGELLPCWAAQLVGALLAGALARLLVAAPAVAPLQDVGLATLLVSEALFAFALCFVVLDREHGEALAALTVVAGAALLDPVAASAFNPAAAFGQAVAGISEWTTIWVYLLACPAGGAVAALASAQPRSRSG